MSDAFEEEVKPDRMAIMSEVLKSYSPERGDDLRSPKKRKEVLQDIKSRKPKLVLMVLKLPVPNQATCDRLEAFLHTVLRLTVDMLRHSH